MPCATASALIKEIMPAKIGAATLVPSIKLHSPPIFTP